ncbi:hypothetical protein ACCO45_001278 [Purpureocillium lilacinum]|uniref:Uncharacterized protein n=1 Tax=Purpureocillium lilacinum TaxID=33203 RepID=A0ACC4E973_PURLI
MTDSTALGPPPDMKVTDPGARQLSESSDDEDQFTDAQSGPVTPRAHSPVPTTRVEKVDNEPSYGEIPGTEAYEKREGDADPDEIAVIPDRDGANTPQNERGEENDDEPPMSRMPRFRSLCWRRLPVTGPALAQKKPKAKGVTTILETTLMISKRAAKPSTAPATIQPSTLPFPIPDFDSLSMDEVITATEPYLDTLFPPQELDFITPPPLPKDSTTFLTPRSASLWSQLVAPPPLAPPDWIRSRTRRLFLVSLGVPVDLDEILPASKQKKLVLPSLNISATSPRTSSDSRSASRLRQGDGNASSTSVDTQGRPKESKRRKGAPQQPELDLVAARYLCTTTDEALDGMTNEELKQHVEKLESIQGAAKDVLEYWQKRTDEKIGDREAFEGVIENLVKHARKVRK